MTADQQGALPPQPAVATAGEARRNPQIPPARFNPLLAVGIGIASVSFSAILIRYAFGDSPDPKMAVTISFYRLLFATLALAPFALAKGDWLPVTGRDVRGLTLVGVILAAHFTLWIGSLAFTSIANSVVIVSLEAIFVPLGAHFVLKERVPKGMALGVLVAFLGTTLVFANDFRNTETSRRALLGDGMSLVAGLAAAAYFLAGRRFRQRLGLLVYALAVYGTCTLTLLAIAVATDAPLSGFPARLWLLFGAMALFPHLLGHTMLNWALRWVPAPVVTIAVVAEPVVSSLLAIILFAEIPGRLAIPGALLTLGAVAYVMWSEARRPKVGQVAPAPT